MGEFFFWASTIINRSYDTVSHPGHVSRSSKAKTSPLIWNWRCNAGHSKGEWKRSSRPKQQAQFSCWDQTGWQEQKRALNASPISTGPVCPHWKTTDAAPDKKISARIIFAFFCLVWPPQVHGCLRSTCQINRGVVLPCGTVKSVHQVSPCFRSSVFVIKVKWDMSGHTTCSLPCLSVKSGQEFKNGSDGSLTQWPSQK